jgi:prevent-host-death family protein
MTIHVNIGEAKTRLSELVAAALRGEEVVLNRAGKPVVRLVPEQDAAAIAREAIAAKRRAMFGKHAGKFTEDELTIPDESADEYEDRRFERKFGYPPPA